MIDHLPHVKPTTLKANVTEMLRQLIIDGTLAPGTEFNQAQIAEQLGVSRGPIREALGQLEQEGLLQIVPYKGVIVTPLTRKYVEELYSVRTALELLALERCVERMVEADFEQLDAIVDQMRAAAQDGDLSRLVDIDLRFHEFLLECADHELVLKLWHVLEVGIKRCLHTRHVIYTFLDEVVGSHPTLVTALRDRNLVWAVQIMSDHIAESVGNILENWPAEADSTQELSAEADPAQELSAEV